jgi:hypothetical protein
MAQRLGRAVRYDPERDCAARSELQHRAGARSRGGVSRRAQGVGRDAKLSAAKEAARVERGREPRQAGAAGGHKQVPPPVAGVQRRRREKRGGCVGGCSKRQSAPTR